MVPSRSHKCVRDRSRYLRPFCCFFTDGANAASKHPSSTVTKRSNPIAKSGRYEADVLTVVMVMGAFTPAAPIRCASHPMATVTG